MLSKGTAVRVALQTLQSLEELHSCGFLSRDVKPQNFAVGSEREMPYRTIFVFDFGLARRYVDGVCIRNWV